MGPPGPPGATILCPEGPRGIPEGTQGEPRGAQREPRGNPEGPRLGVCEGRHYHQFFTACSHHSSDAMSDQFVRIAVFHIVRAVLRRRCATVSQGLLGTRILFQAVRVVVPNGATAAAEHFNAFALSGWVAGGTRERCAGGSNCVKTCTGVQNSKKRC